MVPRNAGVNASMRRAAREKIVAGSLAVFAERGFAGASMREIADRCGVSKGLAYHYFESKQELLVAAMRSRLDALLEVTERVQEHDGAVDRLAALIDGLIGHVLARPDVFRLYLSLTLHVPAGAREEAFAELSEPLEKYLRRVEDLFVELGSTDAELDASLFRSTLLGVCVRLAAGEAELPVEALRDRLLDVFAIGRNSGEEAT